MKAIWIGVIFSFFVIYFGLVNELTNPKVLLNFHAIVLVCGGTVAISLLSYSYMRLSEVLDFVFFGFLFRLKKSEAAIVRDLLSYVDVTFGQPAAFQITGSVHPFIDEAFRLLENNKHTKGELAKILRDRRNAVRRRYVEDAQILNNIAKYPPHLGLLGAASGMIEMMAGLGKDGVDSIGGAMAIALSATLWGIALNNFIFLPLSDNSMKAAEDEVYLRDLIIDCVLSIKDGANHEFVTGICFNRVSVSRRHQIKDDYQASRYSRLKNAA